MTDIDALTRVSVDIERDLVAGELVNLIQNPSGDLGGWGWITPVATSHMDAGITVVALVYWTASGTNYFTSEDLPVTAGQYVAASWNGVNGPTSDGWASGFKTKARFEFYNSAGTLVSSSAQTAAFGAGAHVTTSFVVPATAITARLRFDLYQADGTTTTLTSGTAFRFADVTVATAASASQLTQTRTNLVVNPSFETNAANWGTFAATLARTTAQASVGTASGQVTTTPTVVTNLITNPSFEVSTSGWSANGNVASIARVSGGNSGSFCLEATTTSIALHASVNSYVAGPLITSGITPGATYYFAYAIDHAPPGGVVIGASARAILRWYNSSGTQIGSDILNGDADLGSGYLSRYFSAVAPAGAARVQLFPGISWSFNATTGPASTTTTFHVDRVAVLTADTGYFDGSSTDTGTYQYDWTGTAHLSTSTRTTVIDTCALQTVPITVAAGQTYAASAAFRAAATPRPVVTTFTWRNSSGATISTSTTTTASDSTSAWTRYGGIATAPAGTATVVVSFGWSIGTFSSTEVHYLDAALVEAASSFSTYFDGDTTDTASWTYSWSGTANASTSTAVSNVDSLQALPPAYYVNIIGDSAALTIERQELNLSTLSGTVVSTSLDPSQSTLLRPGRRCRVLVDVGPVGGPADWEPIFTGKTQRASVEYQLLNPDEEKRAVISLTAVDNLTRLAQESRPDGVGTIPELPYVLEGCSVPWSVNGSGNQVSSATVVATNDQATAIDQVAVTRDSKGGYAWVDRKGVLQVWDAASISTTVADSLAEADYTVDFGIDYATDRVVNVVNIESYEVNPATGETATVQYGPFRDETSIRQWDAWEKTFTVQGLTSAQITTLANAILAANKTPTRRVNYVVLALKVETISRALRDLYDLVDVASTRAGLSANLRIIGVTHTITATNRGTKWLLKLDFAGDGTVAPPQVIPKPSSSAFATESQYGTFPLPILAAGATGSVAVTFPKAFASTPDVILSSGHSRITVNASSITTTGFSVFYGNFTSTSAGAATTGYWLALPTQA